jgi:hypothetical protein
MVHEAIRLAGASQRLKRAADCVKATRYGLINRL